MRGLASNNDRIAKNVSLLYFRMLLLTLVSLYTSRVILDALGVVDYGIYNVVGGVVTMFTVLSGSLSAAITRFLTYAMGKGDRKKLEKVFSLSITIQFILIVIILILGETIGIWFVNTHLIIPHERIAAANWCYQLSLLALCVNLFSIPYNAAIVAHERMKVFAYISIFEAIIRLAIALTVKISPIDRLIYYAALIVVLSIVVRIYYGIYCKRNFAECTYHYGISDKNLFKEMFSFAGWNLIGSSSYIIREHGGTIITNLFFGPVINAARAISTKVSTVITSFVQNFMVALNPQITKNFASGNKDYMMSLIYRGSRFSYYILFIISLPILLSTNFLLGIWLKEVPECTTIFVQLTLIFGLSECLSNPLITAMLATGNIKNYQIAVGGITLLNIPVSYILLTLGASPESVLIVAIVISQICLFVRIYMLRPMIGLSSNNYICKVYVNVCIVSIIATIIPLIISQLLAEGWKSFIVLTTISMLSSVLTIYYVGCNQIERTYIVSKVRSLIGK